MFVYNCAMRVGLIRKLVLYFVVIPGIPFILGSLGVLIYSFWPESYSELNMPDSDHQAEHIILMTHGLKDTSGTWLSELAGLLDKQYANDSTTQIIPLGWSRYAASMFRCSVNGQRIGKVLAKKFSSYQRLQSMHLIAHSCGSFIIYSLCYKLKSRNNTLKIQASYLDPVSVYGGLHWNYGLKYFGSCADFSEAYIDREDGVPGSDQPLKHAYTFDVTGARKSAGFDKDPHLWPIYYYIRLAREGRLLQYSSDQGLPGRYPKGQGHKQ